MLPDLSSANENQTTLLAFRKNYTGSLLRPVSTTKLPHLLSDTLRILFLRTFENCFTPTNPLELFGPAVKNCWKSPKLTSNLLETDLSTFKQLKSGTLFLQTSAAPHLSPLSRKIWKHIFLKNASLLVCETHFLHSLTIEWMCVCRECGVNMITDVLYSVNLYILFCVKRFELSHVMDIAL